MYLARKVFGKPRWTSKQFNEFKKRITSFDYFASDSCYSELMIAYDIGRIVGFENVFLNPSTSSGKNSDILVNFGNRKIFSTNYYEFMYMNRIRQL